MTNNAPVVVEQIFPVSIDIVWHAITDPDQMRQWFFEKISAFKAEVGFKTKFNVKSEGRDFMHLWTIIEVILLKKISYNWRYEGYTGNSFVHFELFDQGVSTKLRVTAEGIETFPQDIPEFKRESCKAGWEYFIKERLKEFIEK